MEISHHSQMATINKLEKRFYLALWFSNKIPLNIPFKILFLLEGLWPFMLGKFASLKPSISGEDFQNSITYFCYMYCVSPYEVGCDPHLTKLEFSLSKKAFSQVWLTVEPRGSIENCKRYK